jgi:RNA polymerase sigma-70 factor (ECF subfamily)
MAPVFKRRGSGKLRDSVETLAIKNSKTDFEQLTLTHKDYLYHLALSLTRDKFVSEDLVQDTYLKAYLGFNLFREGSNCLAWLSRIMLNTFINNYNRRKRSPVEYSLEGAESKVAQETETYFNYNESDLLYYFVSDEVRQAILSLPSDYRDMLVLSDMRGLPYKEISYMCGSPMGTVRSRLSRGRGLLKRKLLKSGFCSAN